MSRLPELKNDQLDKRQREIHDAILSSRGNISGPFRTWLHSPELADRAQRLGEFARYQTGLAPQYSELAILIVARRYNCQVEWSLHESIAQRSGLKAPIIDAIRNKEQPDFKDEIAEALYDFSFQLTHHNFVDDSTYARAKRQLGAKTLVELTGLIGYYTLVAFTLNAFQVSLPADLPPGLPDAPTF